ncbi:MAG: FmdE family protein [Bacillota bacterium]
METGSRFRRDIEQMIEARDLPGLLRKAGEFHGHQCSYLAYGVMAGLHGIVLLGGKNTGMEEIVAIVETNNCFADGIQVVTDCTFGNNALIYRDYGKTAVTLANRKDRAIRLVLRPEFEDTRREKYPEVHALFDKLVVRREQGTPDEFARMLKLFAEMSYAEIKLPIEEVFRIEEVSVRIPEFAPIFDSVKCRRCGENVMKTRAREIGGGFYCLACQKGDYFEMNGAGIQMRAGDRAL